MDKNELSEIKSKLDQLVINSFLNMAQLKTLKTLCFELSDHLLTEDESRNLKTGYFHTLKQRSDELSGLQEILYNQTAHVTELLNLHTYISAELRELES